MTHPHGIRRALVVLAGIVLGTACPRRSGEGPDHSNQQRRRQRAHHRSGDQQGRRRDLGHRGRPRSGSVPDGSRIYISDEAESTLDVVDAKTLKVTKRVPLSGHPNNMAVGKDGRYAYVGIIQEPGGVDVIDTVSLQRVKNVPTKGTIHNVYVTRMGSTRWRARLRARPST
jgi:YVTN family beta-propeller protein